jgi:hypothetical protein
MRLANPLRGRLWYVLYGVCLVFVVSFILFEALDIDGSSLQVATTSAPFALSQSIGEEPVDDLHVYATATLLKGIVLLEAAISFAQPTPSPRVTSSRRRSSYL